MESRSWVAGFDPLPTVGNSMQATALQRFLSVSHFLHLAARGQMLSAEMDCFRC